jgi:hypothetical protein
MEQKLALYDKDPTFCKQCSKALAYKDSQKGKKFCNHSCAATFSNNKRQTSTQLKQCPICSGTIHNRYNTFCSSKCSAAHVHNECMEINVEKFYKGELTDKSRSIIRKVLLHLGVPYKCAICDLDQWMGKSLPLVLDHIDGKANNNNIDNLRFLCSNCDSQTASYKSKNWGNGRKSLGLI